MKMVFFVSFLLQQYVLAIKFFSQRKFPDEILGSPEINGNLFFFMNMFIHICIIYACAMNCAQSPTVLITHITHGQPS